MGSGMLSTEEIDDVSKLENDSLLGLATVFPVSSVSYSGLGRKLPKL